MPTDAIRPEAIEIGQIYADHHSEGEYILSCHEKLVRYANKSLAAQDGLVEALEAILNVRVCRDGDNIWAGSDRCKKIAREALSAIKGDKS